MNPKDIQGSAKPNLSRLPLAPLMEVIAGMEEGAIKYGPWNWRNEQISGTIYADAAIRHLMQWLSGEDIDPDSGLPHISKAIAGLLILRDAQIHGCSIDNRAVTQDLNIEGAKNAILAVHEKYADTEDEPEELTEEQATLAGKYYGFADAQPLNADAVSENNPITQDDLGCKVILDGAVIGHIGEWDEDDDILPVFVEPVGETLESAYYQADGTLEKGVGDLGCYGKRITHICRPTVTQSAALTVAGGGHRLITKADIGRTVRLRNGQETVIDFEQHERWPFTFSFDDPEYGTELLKNEDCCCERGYTSIDTEAPEPRATDVVELL